MRGSGDTPHRRLDRAYLSAGIRQGDRGRQDGADPEQGGGGVAAAHPAGRHADPREAADGRDGHARGRVERHGRGHHGEDPGQGGSLNAYETAAAPGERKNAFPGKGISARGSPRRTQAARTKFNGSGIGKKDGEVIRRPAQMRRLQDNNKAEG
jgi:hypothetical protein